MNYSEIHTATLDQLTSELGAAGWDSCQAELCEAREAVARLRHEVECLDLIDSDTNEPIREATESEAAESVNAGPEGHILVDGRRCYVA